MKWLILSVSLLQVLTLQVRPAAGQVENEICLIVPPDVQACYKQFENTTVPQTAAQVACLKKLLWNFTPNKGMTAEDKTILGLTGGPPSPGRPSHITFSASAPQPPSGFRTRREFRTLTPREKTKLFAALRELQRTGVIRAFAHLHEASGSEVHRGVSFLPWHRAFLAYFEEELRKVDPDVFLPYWDSTIDFEMSNPALSSLWEEGQFGNGVGTVVKAPFDNWPTDSGWLERDVGRFGRLISKDNVAKILTKCKLKDITQGSREEMLEFWHDGVHVYVGGDMASYISPYDPIFYFHHAFIDYIWELFRERQRHLCGVDPTTDYPEVLGSHAAQAFMPGYPHLQNLDGCKDYWTLDWYNYSPPPVCPACTRNNLTFCSLSRNMCVATRRHIVPLGAAAQERPLEQFQAFSQQFVAEADAQEASLIPTPGRNVFRGPPSDGRTRFTVADDLQAVAIRGTSQEMDAAPPSNTSVLSPASSLLQGGFAAFLG